MRYSIDLPKSRAAIVGLDHSGAWRVLVFISSGDGTALRFVHDRTFAEKRDAVSLAECFDDDFRDWYPERADNGALAMKLKHSDHWQCDEIVVATWQREELERRRKAGIIK